MKGLSNLPKAANIARHPSGDPSICSRKTNMTVSLPHIASVTGLDRLEG